MSPSSLKKPDRPLRRDAAHNRDLLLAAATEVFDTQGLDASVTEIARVAGVGMGTLYRRFPTKAALVEALVHEVLDATIAIAREAAGHEDGTGLERFFEASCAYQAEHPGLLARLWTTDPAAVRTARRLIAALLADAQDHGRIRRDITNPDLTIALFGIRGVLEATRPEAPDAWRRHLELLIAGMRPGADELRHPPLSQARVDKLLTIGDK
ncbi:MAG TPA: helix-turn-helix domain-containing protein [Baekduia sp.]